MHEQMPAYTVYIGKTGAFYMKKWKTRGISLLLALVLIRPIRELIFCRLSKDMICQPNFRRRY